MEKRNALTAIIVSVSFIVLFPVVRAYTQEVVVPAGVPFVKPGSVTVNFKDADIRAVLNYLSEVSGVDIVPSPDVSGPVTLKLTDKPWEVALNIIVKNYGFAYERDGDIIRVVTVNSLKLEELSTEVIQLNYTSAKDAQEAIKDMLTERGKLTYDSRVNAIIVTDLATNIYKIKQVVQALDKKTPQVLIETKIIETVLSNEERLGINWNLVIAASGASRPTTLPFTNWGNFHGFDALQRYFPFGQTSAQSGAQSGTSDVITTTGVSDFPTIQGANTAFPFVDPDQFTYGTLDFSQFSAVLEYLKERSDSDIVSSPRITTLNNKSATIFVGKVYNFPIFEQAALTGEWVINGYESREIGIKLLVTPHVNETGDISVHLVPEIGNYLGLQTISESLKAPLWSSRKADTQVMVRDGQTIFIGGLIRENVKEYDKKFPILGDLLGDVPFIGPAFKYKSNTKEKVELVFFMTVHVAKDLKAMTKYATRDVSELYIDPDEAEKTAPPGTLNAKDFEEERKPLFDFRKNKE